MQALKRLFIGDSSTNKEANNIDKEKKGESNTKKKEIKIISSKYENNKEFDAKKENPRIQNIGFDDEIEELINVDENDLLFSEVDDIINEEFDETDIKISTILKYYKAKEEVNKQNLLIDNDLREIEIYRSMIILAQGIKTRYDGKLLRMKKRCEAKIRKVQRENGVTSNQIPRNLKYNKMKKEFSSLQKKYEMLKLKFESISQENNDLRRDIERIENNVE